MTSKFFAALYWIAGTIHVVAEATGNEIIQHITKPMLMPLLGICYYLATSEKRTLPHKLILAGFLFSWSGDVNLMFVNVKDYFFLLGLVSFLITHIFYIIAFQKDSVQGSAKRIMTQKPYASFPIILAYAALLYLLYPRIEPDMKIPVVVYASVITIMVLAALNRFGRVSGLSFILVFGGAVLFMLSDSIIAINKFYQPFQSARIMIMSAYITSQFLIAKGTGKTK